MEQNICPVTLERCPQTPQLSELIRDRLGQSIHEFLPYLREGMTTITSKVFGRGLYLPIIPRGDIAVELDDEVSE